MEVTKRTLRQFGLMVGGIFLLIGRGAFYLHIVLSRLRKNYVGTPERRWSAHVAQQKNISAGCSKGPFSKAAASEEAKRTLRYIEPLSDARTPNGKRRVSARRGRAGETRDFFSILLKVNA